MIHESLADIGAGWEVLGDGKLLQGSGRGEQLSELFHRGKDQLARYNLRDGELDGTRVFSRRTVRRAVAETSYLELDTIMMLPVSLKA